MKYRFRSKFPGARILVFTLFLVALAGVTLWTMTYSFSNLLKAFDVLLLVIFVLSTYFTLVLVYSIVTIFYHVDKLKGRQKRVFRFLEIGTGDEGGER